MSARMTGMVFDRYPNGGGEFALALALADNAHEDGTHIYPSVATMARKSRQSERTVQYQLQKMLAMRWLILVREEQRGQPGRDGAERRGREYRINPDWVAGGELPPVEPADDGADERKGANSAPFQRVQSEAGKGATDDTKGCKAFAPEPTANLNSNQQREAHVRASAPASPPPNGDAPGSLHGAKSPGPDPDELIELPLDWQPDDACAAMLAGRQKPMPAQFVVDKFVAHWQGRLITRRLIAKEFLGWVCREAGFNGGKVPVDSDSASSQAEAEAAWAEVREANRGAKWPAKWKHDRTADALKAIGGTGRIRDMYSSQVEKVQREFITAFLGGSS